MPSRLKILLSAYACEPGKGSEPGVGWSWAEQMSRLHEVWVITRSNNQAAIEGSGLEWVQNVHWVYYDPPAWLTFWKKGNRGVQVFYYLWQIGAWLKARKLLRQTAFDLAHHVTFGNYWLPSWIGLLPIPFVFGPVGGGEVTPEPLLSSLTPKQQRYERLRRFLQKIFRFDPVQHCVMRRAAVISATDETGERVQAWFRPTFHSVQAQCGLSAPELAMFGALKPKSDGPFRLISMGRLVHWKGYHLSLMAFARLLETFPEAEYWLASDGPERPTLEALAAQLGCGDQVKFWGRLPKLDELYAKLEQSDVLVHPAMHEAFGVACMESMASGRPVICLNRGGPALLVTPETGIAVEPGTVEETVARLAGAMLCLAQDSPLRQQMGQNARIRIAHCFSWEKMAEKMNEVYQQMVRSGLSENH
jgi:glycosyltransferase involved in cell wall biosynthesis